MGEKKNELKCLIVHTVVRASESHSWYLDSRCSHHMTRNKSLFTSFTEFDGGNVTFGDGNMARVKDKGTICAPEIPNLGKVLYVEGLKVKLISISQICENEFNVQFSQNLCKMFDLNDACVMIGLRTCDNCYVVSKNLLHPLLLCVQVLKLHGLITCCNIDCFKMKKNIPL